MKFMLFLLPMIPATLADRKKLRPIAYHSDRWQAMFQEVVELAQCAEELGFDAVAFPEHHLHSEGFQMGAPLELLLYVALQPNVFKSALLATFCLAVTTAWSDQLTHGRSFVGIARGYQQRWLNQVAQKVHVSATTSDQSTLDETNRRAF